MLKNIFAKKKKRRIALLLIIIPFIVLIGVFGYFGYKSISSLVGSEDTSDKYYIESMNYKLRSNATEYQIELFNELSVAIEEGTDEVKIAELVAKNFVADYFTWTNKAGSYDVGGVYYIYSPYHSLFVQENRDNFYKYVSYYIDKYGSEALLEVIDIETVASKKNDEKYTTTGGDEYTSYEIELSWTYNDYTFDKTTDYMNYAYFTVIVDSNGRYEIVRYYGNK